VHTMISYTTTDPANIRNILSAGGGALMDIGCYAVSMARWLFQAEPGRVMALVTRDPSFGTDILSSAVLDFGQGRSLFTVSTQAYSAQRVEVLGTGGRISIWVTVNAPSDTRGRLTVTTPVGEREPELPLADQYGLEFEEFSRALREGRPAPTPPEDAVANQKVLDALLASERSGGWERL
jgi:predicted dehydrogenase